MFKSCYGTIQIIRKLENFVGYRLRKHLVESIVLLKLDYCDTLYYPLPEFQVKRFQRAQLIATSFVLIRVITSKTAKRFPRSQTCSPGFALPQLAVLRTTRYS
ncbi:hypothetical protein pdam_00024784 [Pocillopora damicornis]|uniref:Uncharacterized protein n=1 Tax=Pocillopora damicornis TaxID=46731 RepID=A0A3M6U4Q6_POCDA|nr:hypothetical protein pdam_00024784 [Pocillopora damicornis]